MRCSHDPHEAMGSSVASIPVSRRAALWNRLERKWSQIQVGHQGTYSIERLELLHGYCQTTSLSRAILVCLLTPVPALLAAILLECLPLRPTSEGWDANWMFWIRHSLVTFLIFTAGNRQLDLYVPENNIPACRQLSLALVTCVVQMGTYIAEAVLVGFPVPFMWQFGVLSVGICVPIMTRLIYGRVFFAKGSALQQQYKNFQDTIFMNLIVTGVYPFCRVLYDFLPQAYQGVVVIVLSIWKFAAKRFAVRMSCPVEDFIPELVAFSVDFFGSLFISVCMSTSGSFYLTALFIAVDVVHLVAKFREISSDEETILEMLQTRRQRSKWLSKSADCGDLVVMIVTVVRNPSKFRVTSLNGIRLWANPPHLIPKEIYRHLQTLESTGLFGPRRATAVARTVFSDEKSRYRLTSWAIRRTTTHIVPSPVRLGISADATRSFREESRPDHLVRHGLQLLFRFEYLMLVEYIECVVPFVYLAYKSVLEQLPNVVYYPCGAGKWGVPAVTNLLVFGVLEVGSLVLVHFFLRRKLAFSPLHQLAFVLETQFYTVQASLFSLMLFTLQYQLAHLGVDFTFRFDWLR